MFPTEVDPLIGQTVAGRYTIIERIGEGGVGVVYRAEQQPLGRPAAVKVLLPEMAENERTVKRFMQEALVISQLRHPNNVTLYDFGRTEDGQLYMAMEFLAGGQLSDRIEEGPFPPVRALRIALQICQALIEAHGAGITHRDLKPENVLFDRVHGQEDAVRVVDFGIAKLHLNDQMLTAPGTRLGTPAYMAPEQAMGQEVDGRADLYALGVILYEMLAGKVPFESDSPVGLRMAHLHSNPKAIASVAPGVKVDEEIEALIHHLLAKDKEDRPASAEVVADRLEAILLRIAPRETGPMEALPPPKFDTSDQDVRVGGEPPWKWIALAALAAAAAATAVVLLR